MAEHTSFRCGGAAAAYCEPADEAALIACVRELHGSGRPYFLLGNGTNVLVRDEGYAGTVVSTRNLAAGALLSAVCRQAAERGLCGLEPLSGIPGTLGGAVRMNAGAYGAEIGDFVREVRVYDPQSDKQFVLLNNDCRFGYRASVFQERPWVILDVALSPESGDPAEALAKIREFARRRNEKQPMELPSAGSFFKRPEGDFAARLIEEAGLKGYAVGGAAVSEKHAGFLVNTGGATAADVLAVAAHVKEVVFAKFGILLEEEPVVL